MREQGNAVLSKVTKLESCGLVTVRRQRESCLAAETGGFISYCTRVLLGLSCSPKMLSIQLVLNPGREERVLIS